MGWEGSRCLAGCQPGRSPRLVPGPGAGAAVLGLPAVLVTREEVRVKMVWVGEERRRRRAGAGGPQGPMVQGEGAPGHPSLAVVEQGAGGPTAPQPGIAGVEEGVLVVHDGGAGGGHRGEAAPSILGCFNLKQQQGCFRDGDATVGSKLS